jgi:DNA-binding response OmpR family regulator
MRILIVDDEEMICELIHVTLSQDPRFEVFQASSGEQGVEAAGTLEPDLVLLDVRMPGIDGVEACKQIRAEHGSERPVIIMISALGEDDDIEQARDAGADDYFIKPFSPRAVLSRVYELFDIAA